MFNNNPYVPVLNLQDINDLYNHMNNPLLFREFTEISTDLVNKEEEKFFFTNYQIVINYTDDNDSDQRIQLKENTLIKFKKVNGKFFIHYIGKDLSGEGEFIYKHVFLDKKEEQKRETIKTVKKTITNNRDNIAYKQTDITNFPIDDSLSEELKKLIIDVKGVFGANAWGIGRQIQDINLMLKKGMSFTGFEQVIENIQSTYNEDEQAYQRLLEKSSDNQSVKNFLNYLKGYLDDTKRSIQEVQKQKNFAHMMYCINLSKQLDETDAITNAGEDMMLKIKDAISKIIQEDDMNENEKIISNDYKMAIQNIQKHNDRSIKIINKTITLSNLTFNDIDKCYKASLKEGCLGYILSEIAASNEDGTDIAEFKTACSLDDIKNINNEFIKTNKLLSKFKIVDSFMEKNNGRFGIFPFMKSFYNKSLESLKAILTPIVEKEQTYQEIMSSFKNNKINNNDEIVEIINNVISNNDRELSTMNNIIANEISNKVLSKCKTFDELSDAITNVYNIILEVANKDNINKEICFTLIDKLTYQAQQIVNERTQNGVSKKTKRNAMDGNYLFSFLKSNCQSLPKEEGFGFLTKLNKYRLHNKDSRLAFLQYLEYKKSPFALAFQKIVNNNVGKDNNLYNKKPMPLKNKKELLQNGSVKTIQV